MAFKTIVLEGFENDEEDDPSAYLVEATIKYITG
jgi:hypothetical protein